MELEELSDATTQSLVKPAPVDWVKHLIILVKFELFTFGQNCKSLKIVLQDNEFEIDILLSEQHASDLERQNGEKSWSHIFLMEFIHLENFHIFSFEAQERSLERFLFDSYEMDEFLGHMHNLDSEFCHDT